MSELPWLTLLIAVPLVGALVVPFVPGRRGLLPQPVGLGFAALTLRLVAVVIDAGYDADGGMQFTEEHDWIAAFGVHYALGVDGLGLLMVLLTVSWCRS